MSFHDDKEWIFHLFCWGQLCSLYTNPRESVHRVLWTANWCIRFDFETSSNSQQELEYVCSFLLVVTSSNRRREPLAALNEASRYFLTGALFGDDLLGFIPNELNANQWFEQKEHTLMNTPYTGYVASLLSVFIQLWTKSRPSQWFIKKRSNATIAPFLFKRLAIVAFEMSAEILSLQDEPKTSEEERGETAQETQGRTFNALLYSWSISPIPTFNLQTHVQQANISERSAQGGGTVECFFIWFQGNRLEVGETLRWNHQRYTPN